MNRGIARLVLGIGVTACSLPGMARAQPASVEEGESAAPVGGLRVTTSGCSRLRQGRIERLLSIELATLIPGVTKLPVLDADFSCTEAGVHLTLSDSLTQKTVARDVPLVDSANPERLLAVSASELFLASWAELLIRKPDDRTRAENPAVVAAEVAVEKAADRAEAPSGRSAGIAIEALMVGRERNLSAAVPTLGAAIRVAQANAAFCQLFASLGWEAGATDRVPGGHVDVSAGTAALGVRASLHFAHAELGALASASLVYLSLRGTPGSATYHGERHDGLAAELSTGLEAMMTFGRTRFGSGLSVGALEPRVSGHVAGGAPARIDGAMVAATLFVGLEL